MRANLKRFFFIFLCFIPLMSCERHPHADDTAKNIKISVLYESGKTYSRWWTMCNKNSHAESYDATVLMADINTQEAIENVKAETETGGLLVSLDKKAVQRLLDQHAKKELKLDASMAYFVPFGQACVTSPSSR